MVARPFLLLALILTLASCASTRPAPPAYTPPKIDCGVFDPPKVRTPFIPDPKEKDVAVWQLNAFGWQQYGEHLLDQRIETAACVQRLIQQGAIR